MTVVFMKINGKQLDPKDSYESDYYGGSAVGSSVQELGMDGSLVVGFFGKTTRDPNSTFNGFGLITIPKPQEANPPDEKPNQSPPTSNNGPSNQPPRQSKPQGSIQSTPTYKLGGLDANVVAYIAAAIKNNKTRQTELVGGGGEAPFRNLWAQGSIMVGFDIAYAGSGEQMSIAAIREVLWSTTGKTISAWHGDPNNRTVLHIGAKPGYAVGAVKVSADSNIDGLTVVFMKFNGTQLDPRDSYESDYYGGAGGRESTIAGDGSLIVGIYGMASTAPNGTVSGFGLFTIPGK